MKLKRVIFTFFFITLNILYSKKIWSNFEFSHDEREDHIRSLMYYIDNRVNRSPDEIFSFFKSDEEKNEKQIIFSLLELYLKSRFYSHISTNTSIEEINNIRMDAAYLSSLVINFYTSGKVSSLSTSARSSAEQVIKYFDFNLPINGEEDSKQIKSRKAKLGKIFSEMQKEARDNSTKTQKDIKSFLNKQLSLESSYNDEFRTDFNLKKRSDQIAKMVADAYRSELKRKKEEEAKKRELFYYEQILKFRNNTGCVQPHLSEIGNNAVKLREQLREQLREEPN